MPAQKNCWSCGLTKLTVRHQGWSPGLPCAQPLDRRFGDVLVVPVAVRLVADRALQVGAVGVRIGQPVEAIDLSRRRRLYGTESVPLADIGRLIPGSAQQLAIGGDRPGSAAASATRVLPEPFLIGLQQPALLAVEAGDQHPARRRAGRGGGVVAAELHAPLPERMHVRHEAGEEPVHVC